MRTIMSRAPGGQSLYMKRKYCSVWTIRTYVCLSMVYVSVFNCVCISACKYEAFFVSVFN